MSRVQVIVSEEDDRIGLGSGISRAVVLHSINLAPEHRFLDWKEGIQLGGFHRCSPN